MITEGLYQVGAEQYRYHHVDDAEVVRVVCLLRSYGHYVHKLQAGYSCENDKGEQIFRASVCDRGGFNVRVKATLSQLQVRNG